MFEPIFRANTTASGTRLDPTGQDGAVWQQAGFGSILAPPSAVSGARLVCACLDRSPWATARLCFNATASPPRRGLKSGLKQKPKQLSQESPHHTYCVFGDPRVLVSIRAKRPPLRTWQAKFEQARGRARQNCSVRKSRSSRICVPNSLVAGSISASTRAFEICWGAPEDTHGS